MKVKRILALAVVIGLVLLYLSTLIFALIDHPLATSLLSAALFCTVVIPAALYGYQLIIKYLKERNSDK